MRLSPAAGSGIGQAIAQRFAREGAKVVIGELNMDGASGTVEMIQSAGGEALAVPCNVSVKAEVDAMVQHAVDTYGGLTTLVNNAAISSGAEILEMDERTWEKDINVVLKSVYLCCKASLPHMIAAESGAIVNIASVNGLSGFGHIAYSAAKAGVINVTKNLALTYGGDGIRVNAICPGTIQTPIWQERVDKDPIIFERLSKWYPLGRVGQPEDIANAALFLASDEASWITGEALTVDGGLMAGSYRMSRELNADDVE